MTDTKDLSTMPLSESTPESTSRKCPMNFKPNKNGAPFNVDVFPATGYENLSHEEFFAKRLQELTGTENKELALDVVQLGASALCGSEADYQKHNIILQSLSEQQLKDLSEARLCTQAAALYSHGMKYLYRVEQEDRIPQCEFYMKNAIKFLRLHNETIEALNKHRRGGEQRVVVQHVNVNDGGRAIVGGVLNGGTGVGGGAIIKMVEVTSWIR